MRMPPKSVAITFKVVASMNVHTPASQCECTHVECLFELLEVANSVVVPPSALDPIDS